MILNSDMEYRRSIRLKEYDYSQPGAYFVTICTQNKECQLGQNIKDNIELLPAGEIACKYWLEIPEHFKNVELDAFIVMPNHIHGIIILTNGLRVQHVEPLQNTFQHIIPKSVGSVIRSYKATVTRWCHANGWEHFRWQENYYEHIIRNEDDLNQVREYILYNPIKWDLDMENPESFKKKDLMQR